MKTDLKQIPFISRMQKIVIYETKSRYFIVGSNNTETAFRVLKIDRSENDTLDIIDDKVEYTPRQVKELLHMIDAGNITALNDQGLKRVVSSFGIVGFVRFLEGYYIILITKRRTVAMIGPHSIYKIDDTTMLYIPRDVARAKSNVMEQKYVKMFQSTDLSSNFYYSYSYELTQTLQYNMAAPQLATPTLRHHSAGQFQRTSARHSKANSFIDSIDVDDSPEIHTNLLTSDLADDASDDNDDIGGVVCSHVIGYRAESCDKYSWNHPLLKEVLGELHYDWLLSVTHGFIRQSNIVVYGKPIYVTLIARRSSRYAGTRFLKRGANCMGYCANDVETEQIVVDASRMSFDSACVTSFVQIRGSVPCKWSQQSSKKVIPKPMITLDQGDPYSTLAAQHFNRLLSRHGSPIVVLSLVKTKEKKPREQKLGDQMRISVKYLNQFLPHRCHIRHHAFDMSRYAKRRNINVLDRLRSIGEYYLKTTGFFSSFHDIQGPADVTYQHGIIRTHCVDSLDRTNTAQFAIGMAALNQQLRYLGVVKTSRLQFDTDCARMLEHLYDSHGDILALQYAGSQLVHRVRTYKKISPWTSSSRDMMHTLSRYYSNTFSDADKQDSMNLFLRVYLPHLYSSDLQIWNLNTDFYLHNSSATEEVKKSRVSLTQWFDRDLLKILPQSREIVQKGKSCTFVEVCDDIDDRLNLRFDYYKPYVMTSIESTYEFQMLNSIRDYMPSASTSYSPFVVRTSLQRRISHLGNSSTSATPANSLKSAGSAVSWQRVRAQDTISDPDNASSDDTDSLSSTRPIETDEEFDSSNSESVGLVSFTNSSRVRRQFAFEDIFSSTLDVYGVNIQPLTSSVSLYERADRIERLSRPLHATATASVPTDAVQFVPASKFNENNSKFVNLKNISRSSLDIYENYVARSRGYFKISARDTKIYTEYVQALGC